MEGCPSPTVDTAPVVGYSSFRSAVSNSTTPTPLPAQQPCAPDFNHRGDLASKSPGQVCNARSGGQSADNLEEEEGGRRNSKGKEVEGKGEEGERRGGEKGGRKWRRGGRWEERKGSEGKVEGERKRENVEGKEERRGGENGGGGRGGEGEGQRGGLKSPATSKPSQPQSTVTCVQPRRSFLHWEKPLGLGLLEEF